VFIQLAENNLASNVNIYYAQFEVYTFMVTTSIIMILCIWDFYTIINTRFILSLFCIPLQHYHSNFNLPLKVNSENLWFAPSWNNGHERVWSLTLDNHHYPTWPMDVKLNFIVLWIHSKIYLVLLVREHHRLLNN